MCGILAILNSDSKVSSPLCNLVTDGIMVTSLRGTDSTGIYQSAMDKNGDMGIWQEKEVMQGSNFVRLSEVKAIANDADTAFSTVVHCRAATRGGISVETAHPFTHAPSPGKNFDEAFVHNGTLATWNAKDFKSDSAQLSSEVYKEGAAALDDLKGAWAVVWSNNTKKKHYVARNGERTLYYAFVEDRKTVIISSEMEMLSLLAARNKVKLKDDAIYMFEEHQLYTFDFDDVTTFGKTAIIKPLPVTNNVTQMYPSRYSTNYNDGSQLRSIVNKVEALFGEKPSSDTGVVTGVTAEEEEALSWYAMYINDESELIIKAKPMFWDPGTRILTLDIQEEHKTLFSQANDVLHMRDVSSAESKALFKMGVVDVMPIGIHDSVPYSMGEIIIVKLNDPEQVADLLEGGITAGYLGYDPYDDDNDDIWDRKDYQHSWLN